MNRNHYSDEQRPVLLLDHIPLDRFASLVRKRTQLLCETTLNLESFTAGLDHVRL